MSKPVEVLITLPFQEEQLRQLAKVSPRLKLNSVKARRAEDIPAEVWAAAEVLYTARVLPLPEQAPRLRWVQFHWAGVDHALDAPLLKKPELIVTTLSGAAAPQMAEFALSMLLALGHSLPILADLQAQKRWPEDRWDRFQPRELRDSTVGIVGYGSVGRQTARLLQGFGAKVLAAKHNAMHPEDTGYTIEGLGDPQGDFVHRLYPIQALNSMLKECDAAVICTPLTPETSGLVGEAALAALKPGAFLVDVSRGGVLDHTALLHALQSGRLGGAALDVFPNEPLPNDSPLWSLPNVIITPHIAGYSRQYDQRAAQLFSENLTRYLAELPLFNRVNLERKY